MGETTIHLTAKSAYYYGDIELWTQQRIAAEYGVSKGAVRNWVQRADFPVPFATTPNQNIPKAFYRADDIRQWALSFKPEDRPSGPDRPGRPRVKIHDRDTSVEAALVS